MACDVNNRISWLPESPAMTAATVVRRPGERRPFQRIRRLLI